MCSSDLAIDRFFANPGKLTYGTEPADQAVERFDAAVESAIDDSDARNIMIVRHGTVISLFLSRHTGISPMDMATPEPAVIRCDEPS